MASARSNKDKAMAAYMKEHKIQRSEMRCPMCHRLTGINGFERHLFTHMAGSRRKTGK